MKRYYVGVDLGGTKILAAVLDAQGELIERLRVPTPHAGPDGVTDTIAKMIADLLDGTGIQVTEVSSVGVGVPGPADVLSGVVHTLPNLPGWTDVPLAELLANRLGLPVYLENDANAAAMGEWRLGAGQGVNDLIYVTVSTGIGGGLILNGVLYRGVSGGAGEVGHMLVSPGGPQCGCGRYGCLEAVASGTAIARDARNAVSSGRPSALSSKEVESLTAADVAKAALAGDQLSREIFARATANLGIAIVNLVNVLNPARVIVGGGVAKSGALLMAPIQNVVRREAFHESEVAVEIVASALGDNAGVVGAAAVARERQLPL